jgi:hypothetical protein
MTPAFMDCGCAGGDIDGEAEIVEVVEVGADVGVEVAVEVGMELGVKAGSGVGMEVRLDVDVAVTVEDSTLAAGVSVDVSSESWINDGNAVIGNVLQIWSGTLAFFILQSGIII